MTNHQAALIAAAIWCGMENLVRARAKDYDEDGMNTDKNVEELAGDWQIVLDEGDIL